ncbi:pilus assembly protein [Kluyvera genomosp. 1]|uniref:pilus assembly protein n=1 Tax=Kluyvera genomosp. 1 TaxID=2774053 RepID=UPI000B17F5E3|nr:pilus assembly protein [Kluyvera genomosp. 1]
MAFKCWQLGLHLQQDNVVIVALQHSRCGWSLKRWWQLPLPPTTTPQQADEALLAVLSVWRRELPWQHALSIAFPARRTLQKSLPRAALTLRENEQSAWIASAMSQQLEMPSTSLCFDYHLADEQGNWNVTAAQQQDVSRLQRLAQTLRLKIAAITPDACALKTFLPQLEASDAVLVWCDRTQWLWASREGWGYEELDEADISVLSLSAKLGVEPHRIVRCMASSSEFQGFDPWDAVAQKHPPYPLAVMSLR